LPIRIPFPQIKVRPVVAESLSLLHPLKVEIVEFLEDEHDLVDYGVPIFSILQLYAEPETGAIREDG